MDKEGRDEWLAEVQRDFLPQEKLPALPNAQRIPHPSRNIKDGFDPVHAPLPDERLFCLDNTFFLGSNIPPPAFPTFPSPDPLRSYEGEGWIEAGQYLHFTDEVEDLADFYLMEMFEVGTMADVPPIITVHIRRGDFAQARGLTSIDKYTDGVARARRRLQRRMDDPATWRGPAKNKASYPKGLKAADYIVVATTDEKRDSDFVQELLGLGWLVLDHERMQTEEKFGSWMPMIIDQAILARGKAFVGTEWSTYS